MKIVNVLTVTHTTQLAVHCIGKSSRDTTNGTEIFHSIASCCEHTVILVSLLIESPLYQGICS
jgi:hypothetical protein